MNRRTIVEMKRKEAVEDVDETEVKRTDSDMSFTQLTTAFKSPISPLQN